MPYVFAWYVQGEPKPSGASGFSSYLKKESKPKLIGRGKGNVITPTILPDTEKTPGSKIIYLSVRDSANVDTHAQIMIDIEPPKGSNEEEPSVEEGIEEELYDELRLEEDAAREQMFQEVAEEFDFSGTSKTALEKIKQSLQNISNKRFEQSSVAQQIEAVIKDKAKHQKKVLKKFQKVIGNRQDRSEKLIDQAKEHYVKATRSGAQVPFKEYYNTLSKIEQLIKNRRAIINDLAKQTIEFSLNQTEAFVKQLSIRPINIQNCIKSVDVLIWTRNNISTTISKLAMQNEAIKNTEKNIIEQIKKNPVNRIRFTGRAKEKINYGRRPRRDNTPRVVENPAKGFKIPNNIEYRGPGKK